MSMRSRQYFFRLCEKPQAVWNVLIALVFQAALTSELLWPSHLSTIPAFPSVWMPLSPRRRAKTQMVLEHSQSIARTRRAGPIGSWREGKRGVLLCEMLCRVSGGAKIIFLMFGWPSVEKKKKKAGKYFYTYLSFVCRRKTFVKKILYSGYLMNPVNVCIPNICDVCVKSISEKFLVPGMWHFTVGEA